MQFTDNSQVTLNSVLIEYLKWAEGVDIAVAFIRKSGVNLIAHDLQNIIDNRGKIRIIGGQDFGYTEPDALKELSRIGAEIKIFNGEQIFHPKCVIFRRGDRLRIIIGSSNLTSSGLESGVEWNLAVNEDHDLMRKVAFSFEQLWTSTKVKVLSETVIDEIRQAQAQAISDIKRNQIEGKLDFVGASFRFSFTVNPSFIKKPHALTVLKKHYGILNKYLASNHVEASFSVGNKQAPGYMYRSRAGYGVFYQLVVRDREFKKIEDAFHLGQKIEVDMRVYASGVKVHLET